MYLYASSENASELRRVAMDDLNQYLIRRNGQKKYRVIVGIPFNDEDDTLPSVIQIARTGLRNAQVAGESMVLCVGTENRRQMLEKVLHSTQSTEPPDVEGLLLNEGLTGRGWGSKMTIAVAGQMQATAILLSPDLIVPENDAADKSPGVKAAWVERLYHAVNSNEQDLALARFNRHYLAHPVESLLAYPVIAGVFGFRLAQPIPEVCSLSRTMVRASLESESMWSADTGRFGFYPWLALEALQAEAKICEVPLGVALFRHRMGKLKIIFRQVAHILLKKVSDGSVFWLERPEAVFQPQVLGAYQDHLSPPLFIQPRELLKRFKDEFNHFDDTMFRELIPQEQRLRMEILADGSLDRARFSVEDWVNILRIFLQLYRFEKGFHGDDIVDGLFPFFLARLMTLLREEQDLSNAIEESCPNRELAQRMVAREMDQNLARHTELMLDERVPFMASWHEREADRRSYLPRLGEWEFVPHVGVMVPQVLERPDKSLVRAGEIYQELIDRYRGQFIGFLKTHLGMQTVAHSGEIIHRLQRFMEDLELVMDQYILPWDIGTVDGIANGAKRVIDAFGPSQVFQLKEDAAREILERVSPRYLLIYCKCGTTADILNQMSAKRALGIAAWTDQQSLLDGIIDILEKDADPDWFHLGPLALIPIDLNKIQNPLEIRGTAAIGRLTGQLLVSNTVKGREGDFPKLCFFLRAAKRTIGIELFSEIWLKFVEEGIDFPGRVAGSIRGHWARRVLSAHNLFENQHQRILVERLKSFAEQQEESDSVASRLRQAASVYHLAITLPDSTFVPLSAWTWSSFSARGGVGAPTPLSSLVERDWATRDFLTAYLERAGRGDEKTINRIVYELIREGRESEDIAQYLFGMKAEAEELTAPPFQTSVSVPANKMVRPVKGPILEPLLDHWWESKYVLNAAAVRIAGTIYILYRAFGQDQISRIGLAWTKNGTEIDGRLSEPIFEPRVPAEVSGCEDPRISVIGDELYMLYTAYDGKLAQIAMASISIDAFLERRFDEWRRHGLGFPGLSNKDAVLYPETFQGKWAVYHRIDPNMWISYIDDLSCPWPRSGQKIVAGPRPGMMWDSVKIGAGAQPIKTKHGWLNIYHGVDYARHYRLGVLFMDLDDPAKVLYQSPNAVLEPEVDFEIGPQDGGDYWVPHVVFTCGAVPVKDKEILDVDDEIFVYYGAADTAIGVATARIGDLVPILLG